MRIAVKGTSGAGKTTLARRISVLLGIRHVELDALNWGPHWLDLSHADPAEFRRRVDEATAAAQWVSCGVYSVMNELVLGRATHLVWLDYSRARVMRRVIGRSVLRAISRQELWPGTGNLELVSRWLDPEHPSRSAWTTWARNRERCAGIMAAGDFAPLRVERIKTPGEIPALLDRLVQAYEHAGPASV